MNILEVRKKIQTVTDPEERELYMAMDVLLSSIKVGTNVAKLQRETGYSRDFVEAIASRMETAQLWLSFIDVHEWEAEEVDALYLHAQVATGRVQRELQEASVVYTDSENGAVVHEFNDREYVAITKATVTGLAVRATANNQ